VSEKAEHSVLASIDSPKDLKRLKGDELRKLADEVRELILKTTSETGGHLASSLGTVELTIALHRALDAPRDIIIWDVGHQSYAHKILTGRREEFSTLRCYGGLSGFPKRLESPYDVVNSGHSGSSISYGLGLALARERTGSDEAIAVVIGDGSLTAGVAFEAMNQAGHQLGSNLTIILNDNEMSISKNVGGFSAYLSRMRLKPGYTHLKESLEEALRNFPALGGEIARAAAQVKDSITHALVPGVLFESLGFKYVGPIDGHDIALLEETIAEAKEINSPVLLHVLTRKGKGYRHAERSPDRFHGIGPFDLDTGKSIKKAGGPSYTELFSEELVSIAKGSREVVAVTAAMKLGTGLERFSVLFPERFFDVGIAEQLAVNMAAGMAIGGLKPVVAIYSTFLQRAFDQLSQEVCLQDLPVVLAVDRAGLVGDDGETHHGYFDVSYLSMLPNMTVMAPGDGKELGPMLEHALELGRPVAVRFPRGSASILDGVGVAPIQQGRGEVLSEGKEVVLIALGDLVPRAIEAARLLGEAGVDAGVVNARFAKPLDAGFYAQITEGRMVVTLEDNVLSGGFGSAVERLLCDIGGRDVISLGLPDAYVTHGPTPRLLDDLGLSPRSIADDVLERLGRS
jgi:1-deoxy-D-xylulose-5-phosphate synthase